MIKVFQSFVYKFACESHQHYFDDLKLAFPENVFEIQHDFILCVCWIISLFWLSVWLSIKVSNVAFVRGQLKRWWVFLSVGKHHELLFTLNCSLSSAVLMQVNTRRNS